MPATPSTAGDVVSIECGYNHMCAPKTNGTVECWGSNSDNQSSPPADLTDAVAVSVAFYHSCALRDGGAVTCVSPHVGSSQRGAPLRRRMRAGIAL